MRSLLIAQLCLILVACSGAPSDEPASPSPLIEGDSDRLWILARASRVGDGKECKELYSQPDDPRYQEKSKSCDGWSRHYADYLRVNGFPTVEYQHLMDPAYWRWYLAKRQQISDCKEALGYLPVGLRDADKRKEHQFQKNHCDPYDHARNNQKMTPESLGIRFD